MQFDIFTDGGSRGNPGEGAVGVIIKVSALPASKSKVYKFGKRIGRVTNNEAEYQAVIEALKQVSILLKRYDRGKLAIIINIYLDSKLVCNQLRGLYKIKNARLGGLLLKVKILEQETGGQIYYHFIPREKNKEADKLVNLAFSSKPAL